MLATTDSHSVDNQLTSVNADNCQALVDAAATNRRRKMSVKVTSPVEQTLTAQSTWSSRNPTRRLSIIATRFRSVILTNPPNTIVNDLLNVCSHEFYDPEMYRLFIDVAEHCKSIPQLPATFGEVRNIPEISFEVLSDQDDDSMAIKKHVRDINKRFVGYYHDHEQYNINNAEVAAKLLTVQRSQEYEKYLSYINRVSIKLDEIINLDERLRTLAQFSDDDSDDDVPYDDKADQRDNVAKLINSAGEVITYMQDLIAPLIGLMPRVRTHCSKCDATMRAYKYECDLLKKEREEEQERVTRMAFGPTKSMVADPSPTMAFGPTKSMETSCAVRDIVTSPESDVTPNLTPDDNPRGVIGKADARVTALLEEHVPVQGRLPLTDFAKLYKELFGMRRKQDQLTADITATGQFKVTNCKNRKYISRV